MRETVSFLKILPLTLWGKWFVVSGKVIDDPDIKNVPITGLSEAKTATEVIVTWMVGIFWVVAVALVIWAAFLYLSAGGSEDKIKEAKKRLLYAVIAAAIALLANSIDLIVENLLKGA